MHKEFVQMDIAKCKNHTQLVINYLFCKQNCPYSSRLACAKCIKEYNSVEGFEVVMEVLNNPRVILSSIQTKGIYGLLNNYFNLLDQDPDDFISSFKKDIMQQIQKLENDLKEGIEKYKKFRAEITKVHQQFNEALGRDKLRQAFKDILKVENYHDSQEWKQFEGTVQSFVLQFEEQKNQELNEAYYKLKQMELSFQDPQLLNIFKVNVSKTVDLLCQKLQEIEVKSYSSLCDRFYFDELIQRIMKNKNVNPKNVSLIFKASEHGMNAQAFWAKCSNQGPTLTICKSKNGYVFGGYSPCKWVPGNASWQKDESKTSFLFSYTRKEIYPILSVDHAIYCYQTGNYGPTFGGNHNLHIAADFQSGYSRMNGQHYSNESYKIENQQTHLMGDMTPQLVEMEVFLIEE